MTLVCPDVTEDCVVVASGVYAPQHDSYLLIDAMTRAAVVPGRRLLDRG